MEQFFLFVLHGGCMGGFDCSMKVEYLIVLDAQQLAMAEANYTYSW